MSSNSVLTALRDISQLDNKERMLVYNRLKRMLFPHSDMGNLTQDIRESKHVEGVICPHCDSKRNIKYGKYKNIQRYKCKDCDKTFSTYTNTPIYRTRIPDKWIDYLECMVKGMSLRESAEELEVCWTTLFYWRHKILTGLKRLETEKFDGILEIDETYMLYSEKGKKKIKGRKPRKRGGASKYRGISKEQVCILVAKDRNGHTLSKVACMGRLSKDRLSALLDDYIDDKTILCTDAWSSYQAYALEKGLTHYILNATDKKYVIKDIYHIQHVNSYHSRFKDWIKRFKGVASKYLDDYLAWFNFIEKSKYEALERKKRTMLVKSCITETIETFNSLRLASFTC